MLFPAPFPDLRSSQCVQWPFVVLHCQNFFSQPWSALGCILVLSRTICWPIRQLRNNRPIALLDGATFPTSAVAASDQSHARSRSWMHARSIMLGLSWVLCKRRSISAVLLKAFWYVFCVKFLRATVHTKCFHVVYRHIMLKSIKSHNKDQLWHVYHTIVIQLYSQHCRIDRLLRLLWIRR